MKRIIHGAGGGIEVLHVADDEIPTPGTSEVLIEVHFAGVNRPDVLQRSGNYPPPPGASPYLGLEVSGTIVAVGQDVTQWNVGDVVCALTSGGGYAEFCIAEERHCLPVPDGLSLLEAAALPENYFTVWANVFDRAKFSGGMSILIHGGSSGIGLTSIQMAHAFGGKVFATAGSESKVGACLSVGADKAINYCEEDFVEVILRETRGRGVDVVLDIVGAPYIERNIQCLAVEGCLLQIAFLMGSDFAFNAMPIMLKRLTLTGSTLRGRAAQQKAEIANSLKTHVWPLLSAGKCRPVIDTVFPLAQVQKAHALMESSKHVGKIMLLVKES